MVNCRRCLTKKLSCCNGLVLQCIHNTEFYDGNPLTRAERNRERPTCRSTQFPNYKFRELSSHRHNLDAILSVEHKYNIYYHLQFKIESTTKNTLNYKQI